MADEREHVVAPCLSTELLSAYADGRIDARLREEMQAHLAECEECYDIVMELVRAQEAVPTARDDPSGTVAEPDDVTDPTIHDRSQTLVGDQDTAGTQRGPVVPFRPRRKFLLAAAGSLAAAAAIILTARVQPLWWQQLWGADHTSRVARLVEALGEERLVEGRLSGGFRYGPLRSVTRSGPSSRIDDLSLLAAAAELRQAVENDPSPQNRHAWGVAQVLLGEYDEGIRALEETSALLPNDARVHSDLAAGYLARARALGRQDDSSRALAEADRALQLDPAMIEVLFNRGVALEELGLRDQAIAVWRDLRARDQSEWRIEAERRLSSEEPPASST